MNAPLFRKVPAGKVPSAWKPMFLNHIFLFEGMFLSLYFKRRVTERDAKSLSVSGALDNTPAHGTAASN